ncbi:thermonuclease family protein [Hansschlegelia quercus]|nr:thermonuclease family protein [Hansschlegelia quercus]
MLHYRRIMILDQPFSARLAHLACGALAGVVVGAGATLASIKREPAPHGHVERPTSSAAVAASALAVIDGDTLEARIAVFPGQEIVTRIRLAGVDTPERRGRCAGERDAAEKATRALKALVEGRRLSLTDVRGDKYFGRVVARVANEDGDVADALISGGYGRPYGGGRREGWC